MAEVGPKPLLTEELFDKIKSLILEGHNLREIANLAQINEGTLYQWHSKNYSNLADKIEGWKRDYLIKLAEGNVRDILRMDINDKDTLKTVQDTSKFVLETLKKDKYSKKTESDITSNGETIQPVLVKFLDGDK